MGRLLAIVAALVLGQERPHPLPPGGSTSSTVPVSDVALVSWVADRSTASLELAVIWRGSRNWFARGGAQSGSGGGGQDNVSVTINQGGVQLQAELDRRTRVARVNGKTVKLGDDNVILVDNVDAADGLRITRTLRVDPGLNVDGGPLMIHPVLARSREILSFVQCDTPNAGGWCARLLAAR